MSRLRTSAAGFSINQRTHLVFVMISLALLSGIEAAAQESARTPAKLEFTRWSGTLNIPDPVAISFDDLGRAYVTQTQRRKAQDLDIRNNRDWVPDDVGFQTVEEKREFYRQRLAPGVDQQRNRRRVDDLNQDGSHDYHDLMVISEKIHLVEDTDSDGSADRISLFADRFQTEVTGIAAGVLWHDGHVYATIAPDVWKLTDADGDGIAEQREIIATGFGLHVAYAGHDMHGLTVGPDGRIYWSIGDKGISVVSREGREFRYPNQGGVLRCDPDGSNFEVFAHGLRNVQELAFDQYGNLFGVDNDADQPGERERFVFIAQGMDAGWRCNYQYRGEDYNPWTDEGLWKTRFTGQAAYITPPIAYSLNGPAGFAFNPGTALGPEYHDYFFLTGAPNGEQRAFQVEPDGASFRMINEHEFARGTPLVGINFGPDGALYGVDWGGGYPLNQMGAIWKIDQPNAAGRAERIEVRQLLAADASQLALPRLVQLLGHADQRVRLQSQFELVRRNAGETIAATARQDDRQIARVHAVWALGQLGRAGDDSVAAVVVNLLQDQDPELRRQAARIAADLPVFDGQHLVPLLSDVNSAVRFQAALALRQHPVQTAIPAIVNMLAENSGRDLYLRHAGVMALSGLESLNSAEQLNQLTRHPSVEVRLATVVALREQSSPSVAVFLTDTNDLVAAEAARAIHDDWSIADAMQHLARWLEQPASDNEVIVRRAINANYRIGDVASAVRVALYAASTEAPAALRLEALAAIRDWEHPPALDRVDGRNRRTAPRQRTLPKPEVAEWLNRMLVERDSPVRTQTMATMRTLKLPIAEEALEDVVRMDSATGELRSEAIRVLSAQKFKGLPELLRFAMQTDVADLRMTALQLLVESQPERALDEIERAIAQSDSLPEKQQAVLALTRIRLPEAAQQLRDLLDQLNAGKLDSGLTLEVLEAAAIQGRKHPEVMSALERFETHRADRAGKLIPAAFLESVAGGDPVAGRKLFMTHLEAQCIRCHRVGKTGSSVGPELNDVGKRRSDDYLLRSIVSPSADIDPKYRTRLIVLDTGKTVQGVLVKDDGQTTVLADNQGKEIRIENDSIDESIEQSVSIMPDMSKILTRREVRDLVAYLQTLR